MKNPITVRKKGKLATARMGGMVLEEADHVVIEAVYDGEVWGWADVLMDEEGDARFELLSVKPEQRNKKPVILPLVRKVFEFAKEQKAGQVYAEACHQKIYNFLLRFRTPDWVRPNSPLINQLFDHPPKFKNREGKIDPSDDFNWMKGGKIIVPLEDLPPANQIQDFPCRGDAHESDGSSYYDGPKIKKGDFFTDGFKIYQWTKLHAEDGKTASTLVMNVQYRYDYNGPGGKYRPFYVAWEELQPRDLGMVLPKETPLDDPNVRTDRLPMLKMGWFL